jgi:hypothetical protein
MGAGRSGSTVLGVTLGNCTDIFYAGELDKWLLRAGVSPLGGTERSRFWNDVRKDVTDPVDVFGSEARWLERSSALFRPRKWAVRRRLRSSYLRVNEDLYRAVARASESSYVVDSSHYPLRARELQRLGGIDLYLLFLSRNPHDVVRSFMRRDVVEPYFGVWMTNAYLWLTNLFAVLVFLRHPRDRRVFVRYDDFAACPDRVLGQLLHSIGAPAAIPDLSSLSTGVAFQGNRLLQANETIELKRASGARPPRSRITTVLQVVWTIALARLRPAASCGAAPGA